MKSSIQQITWALINKQIFQHCWHSLHEQAFYEWKNEVLELNNFLHNEIISCTSLPLCKVLYWVSMIPVMNCPGHLNKRSLLMSSTLLSLHSLFQLLWLDYCSWEASLNSCPPAHLHLTSLIFHHLKLFLFKVLSLVRSKHFLFIFKLQVLTPTLGPLSEREKKKKP